MDLLNYATRPKTRDEAHALAIALGCRCKECPLFGCARGPVLGELTSNAQLIVIGEAPGTREVQEGRPFVGASGVELDQSLAQGGLARNECTITNTILCQPPEDFDDYLERLSREHKKACEDAEKKGLPPPERKLSPLEACAPRLHHEMQVSASKTVLAVGGKALRAMAHHYGVPYGVGADIEGKISLATIKGQHGSPVRMPDGTILCSSLHPAFAMRNNRQYTQVVRDNIARAARIAKRGHRIDWQEPDYAYFVKWPEDDELRVRIIEEHSAWFIANASTARLAVDIETDSIDVNCLIRVVGMGMTVNGFERVISVPLLWRSGREFWRNASHKARVEAAIRQTIDACHLTFHNGLFDTGVLLRLGLMSDRSKIFFDTMIGHKNTDSNDLPHDLGFVVRQFLEAPLWKKDVDHKASEDVTKDSDLHLYNSRDVVTTMRVQPIIESRIVECGNVPQFRLDANLAPIARDMGRLGLFIDERERGDLSLKFNKITRVLTDKIRTVIGRNDFNPRSAPQVKDFLYDKKGYTPPLNTDGYEWEPGDDPSSSTPSLMKLLDLGVDDQAEQFINAELEFRACDKLRGSYIDNLKVHYDWTIRHDETITWVGDVKAMRAFLACLGQLDPVIIDGAEILPARPEISWMPVTWKIHVIPGGRWVCEPTIQNWPSRGWVVDGKPTNMRKMIIAPPGHVIVGADYEQIELRIYGVVANDQYVLRSFRELLVVNGKEHSDPHCLNAATIMAEHENEIMALYGEFMRKHFYGTKDEKSEMKYIRTVAKRVCIAEGEPVLTDRGLVPIEKVTCLDKLWDGCDWVLHEGVVCNGMREVIEYDGLWATEDHEVWTEDGERLELGEAAKRGEDLSRSGQGRDPIRFVRDEIVRLQGKRFSASETYRVLLRMWDQAVRSLGQSALGEVERLSSLSLWAAALDHARLAALPGKLYEATLCESEESELAALRWAWNQVRLLIGKIVCGVDSPKSWAREIFGDRSNRREWSLRSWESALCDGPGAGPESSRLLDPRGFCLLPEGVAVRETNSHGSALQRIHESGDHRGRTKSGAAQAQKLGANRRTSRVYDILNAGPYHRFTVSDVLVSNCYLKNYGGEEDKLFSAMASERDKATGKRVFPNLQPSRVAEWEERWEKRHPETKRWHRRVQDFVRRNGYAMTPILTHRKRYFVGGPNKKNAPPNHEIQGAAGEIKNEAILRIHEAIPFGKWSRYTGLCMDIHDYLAAFVPEDKADEAIAVFNKCMRTEMTCDDGWKMPIFAEAKASRNLADNA